MSGAKVIFGRLSNTTAITDIVGKKIRPFKLSQRDSNPRVSYQQVGGEETYSNDGDSNFSLQRWQIDCYADSDADKYATFLDLVNAIKEASKDGGPLSGYRGSTNTGGVVVASIFITNDSDIDEGVIEGTDRMEYRHTFDVEITLEK